jgi:hypothetical protein
MELLLLSICLFLCFLNTLIIFFLGVFVVRFNQRINQMFSDLVSVLVKVPEADVSLNLPESKKTWDEKYEEEIEIFSRRLRADSGLSDLPYPNVTKESNKA